MGNPDTFRGVPAIEHNGSEYEPPTSSRHQPVEVKFDDSLITAHYANFCRLTGTPEELLIDFGINPLSGDATAHPVVVSQRAVTSWYTAKRLLYVLHQTIERHEAAFGVLETDVQKRISHS